MQKHAPPCMFLHPSTFAQWRKPGADFGGTEKFLRTKMTFSDKISIFAAKISVLLVIDQVFRIFPLFSLIFRIFTLLNVVHDPFLTRKTPSFTLFILSRTSDNTTSQNIGGTNAWAVPPPQTLGGDRPPVPPRFPPLPLRWRTQSATTAPPGSQLIHPSLNLRSSVQLFDAHRTNALGG